MKENVLRVLLADDDVQLARALKWILDDTKKYDVTTANDGEEALAILERQPFDIVISDIMMPKMCGDEFVKIASERHPNLPFVFISGYIQDILSRHGLGGFRFLAKPFRVEDLMSIIDLTVAEWSCLPGSAPTPNPSPTIAGRTSAPRELFPFIVGGLLHDAKNTLFATREKIRRLEEMCGKTCDDKLTDCSRFIAEHVDSLDRVLS